MSSSSSSSSVTTSTVNGVTRVTGLASGLDVDSIVDQLMVAERQKKYNKLEVKEQTAEWKQDAYRTVISDLQSFSSSYFSTTGSSSIMKASNFLQYTATSSDDAEVSASASSTAGTGSHSVSVTQLATAATLSSSSCVTKDVQGSSTPDYTSLSNESFVIALDGTSYTVDLDDVTSLSTLQSAVDDAVGSDKVTVSLNSSDYLEITAEDSGVHKITVSATSSSNNGLTDLGFDSDDGAILSNRVDTSETLSELAEQLNTSSSLTFSSDGELDMTIKGTAFSFDKDTTVATMMSDINEADLGVTMSYNSTTGKFVLTASSTGAGAAITASDDGTSNFVSQLLSSSTAGTDCKCSVDDESYTQSSNTLTVDGVTYTLNAKTTTSTTATDSSGKTTTSTTDNPVTVSVTQDTDGVYDLISNFVSAYNTLISTLNSTVDEDADSDYTALDDDQKDDMTDSEISSWETKAKVGLLENDSTIEDCVSDMRNALVDSVSGLTTSLSAIGITTGDYSDDGKLEIDEDTLKEAIQSNAEGVMNLFTQQASGYTTDGTDKLLSSNSNERNLSSKDEATRYDKEGIAYRFYDILQKNISTTTDSAGNKGLLLEIAGTSDDTSDTDNQLTTLIDKYSDEIDDEKDRLDSYEDRLYDTYTNLETYISEMNSQLSALSSMTSS